MRRRQGSPAPHLTDTLFQRTAGSGRWVDFSRESMRLGVWREAYLRVGAYYRIPGAPETRTFAAPNRLPNGRERPFVCSSLRLGLESRYSKWLPNDRRREWR